MLRVSCSFWAPWKPGRGREVHHHLPVLHWLCVVQAIQVVPDQFKTFGLRILFDVSFFIIITTIGLNIVFGIIVDTFSELRDERVCMYVYHRWP